MLAVTSRASRTSWTRAASSAEQRAKIGVNLTGVWKSAKAVAPHMIERGSGSIVITSSTNGWEAGLNYAHYVTAKHGVIGLMKNIALELAPCGIRCNSVSPGAIKTPMTDRQGAWDMFAGHPGGTEATCSRAATILRRSRAPRSWIPR
jgi:NAD(P)-dependent dehydrogenase (short-subunit alcohol dehydrogenase family)